MEKNFEQKLDRLEEISSQIKSGEISLTDAVKFFEEGMKLSSSLEKELASIEKKVEILVSGDSPEEAQLESFNSDQEA